jgi:hypothetical protein
MLEENFLLFFTNIYFRLDDPFDKYLSSFSRGALLCFVDDVDELLS